MVCKGISDVKEQKRGIVADELALEKRIVVQKDRENKRDVAGKKDRAAKRDRAAYGVKSAALLS